MVFIAPFCKAILTLKNLAFPTNAFQVFGKYPHTISSFSANNGREMPLAVLFPGFSIAMANSGVALP